MHTPHTTAFCPWRPQHFFCGFTDSGGPDKLLKTSFATLPKEKQEIWNILFVHRNNPSRHLTLAEQSQKHSRPAVNGPVPLSLEKETPPWPWSCSFTVCNKAMIVFTIHSKTQLMENTFNEHASASLSASWIWQSRSQHLPPPHASHLNAYLFVLPADHCVHYYDLRNTKQPIMVFKGHRKAVSYAKFVNGEEIVSA